MFDQKNSLILQNFISLPKILKKTNPRITLTFVEAAVSMKELFRVTSRTQQILIKI